MRQKEQDNSVKKYLEGYKPHWLTRLIAPVSFQGYISRKTNNEMKEELENLLVMDVNAVLEQNINYAYYLIKELTKRKVLEAEMKGVELALRYG